MVVSQLCLLTKGCKLRVYSFVFSLLPSLKRVVGKVRKLEKKRNCVVVVSALRYGTLYSKYFKIITIERSAKVYKIFVVFGLLFIGNKREFKQCCNAHDNTLCFSVRIGSRSHQCDCTRDLLRKRKTVRQAKKFVENGQRALSRKFSETFFCEP